MVILVHLRALWNYTKYSCNSFFYRENVHRENQSQVIISGRKKNEPSVGELNLDRSQDFTCEIPSFLSVSQPPSFCPSCFFLSLSNLLTKLRHPYLVTFIPFRVIPFKVPVLQPCCSIPNITDLTATVLAFTTSLCRPVASCSYS